MEGHSNVAIFCGKGENVIGKIKGFIDKLLGNIYFGYVYIREKDRLWSHSLGIEKNKASLLLTIVKYAKSIIKYLILFGVISTVGDWVFVSFYKQLSAIDVLNKIFVVPTVSFITTGLEIYVGAISAVLGLIFALYTVGFQLSTDRYSEKVTDFINEEEVTNLFFALLVFTDLFSIVVLLKTQFTHILPVVSFIFATALVLCSFLGILIFKTHYINSLKPINLFKGIWRSCKEQLEIATNMRSYKFSSWSLIIRSREVSKGRLNLLGNLYRDLVRDENWNDAVIAPIFMAEVLRDYTDVRKFIDKERGWWFLQRYEKVKADDLTMYPIKANYELQSKGPLHIPKASAEWYEERIFELLDETLADIDQDNTGKLLKNILSSFSTILVGDYKKQVDAPPKVVPGSYQNQEFGIFDKALDRFLPLWKKVDFKKSNLAVEFLNDFFALSLGIVDSWDIEGAISIAEGFYLGDQLNPSKKFLYKKELPVFFRSVLIDYRERLEVEQETEGEIITPKDFFVEEIRKIFTDKRREILNKYLTKVFESSNQIIDYLYRQNEYSYLGQFIKIQAEIISRLIYLGDTAVAEDYAKYFDRNVRYILCLPKDVLVDLEMLEQAEKGYFSTLIERKKELFKCYTKLALYVMLSLRYDETDENKMIQLIRLPLFWGGMAFLISELDQDHYYVITFVKSMERLYKGGSIAQAIEASNELKLSANIFWETTRYQAWYRTVFVEIENKLKKTYANGPGEYGFNEVYDHPSKFIQKLASRDFFQEESSREGFIDWIKRRDEVKKLLLVLRGIDG